MVARHNVELDLRCSILVEYSIFSAKQINKILGKKTYLLYTPCSYDIPIHTEHELLDVIESRMPYSDYLRYYLSRFSCDAIISQNKKVTNLRPSKNMTFNLQRLSSTEFGDFAEQSTFEGNIHWPVHQVGFIYAAQIQNQSHLHP